MTNNDQDSRPEMNRRHLMKTMLAGGLGFAAGLNHEERILLGRLEAEEVQVDGLSGATQNIPRWGRLEDLKNPPPLVSFGKDLQISRVILGGNLFAGWAHSRDLIYVSELIRAYNTPQKIQGTFMLAEACGINAFLSHYSHYAMIKRYWDRGGKMHFFADCRSPEETKISIDQGASVCYINGEKTDEHVAAGRFDVLEAHLHQVRREGLTAGLGAHRLTTVRQVMEKGIVPDFWMIAFHHTDYWSAKHPQEYDNIFCREPKETAEYMKDVSVPWIAFKVLAAGAIPPEVGFQYAIEGGADFLCVGMYDFQIVNNLNIASTVFESVDSLNRVRRWI